VDLYGAGRIKLGTVAGYAALFGNGTVTTTLALDWVNGAKQTATLGGNTAITLGSLGADFVADGLRLITTQDGTGGRVPTFTSPATIAWLGGVTPTTTNGLVTTAGAKAHFMFFWDGTSYVGSWANV
jgi:hypothetical protein